MEKELYFPPKSERKEYHMKMKRLLALIMCAVMLFAICACNNTTPPVDTDGDGTSSATSSILATQQVQTEAIRIPVEEISNALRASAAKSKQFHWWVAHR